MLGQPPPKLAAHAGDGNAALNAADALPGTACPAGMRGTKGHALATWRLASPQPPAKPHPDIAPQ
jgi:hypothetical protein